MGYQLDSVPLTAASGAACTVPIIWKLRSGGGVVWFRALYLSLAIQHPSYGWARQQLQRRGARHCTAEERQLLLTLPGLQPSARMPTTVVISISAACQWLRSVGERQAADELSQHQRPELPPAAARKRAAQQGRAALAAANERAACSCPAGVDPHELLPADSNRGQVAAVARRTWASVAFAAGLHLDTAALTAANGAVFTVPILRPAGAGAGLVRAKALYEGLGVASPPCWLAQQQLNELGARLCTSAEIQLLKMLPGISRFLSGTSIVRVDAACRWLLSAGQREAAAQLAQRERQLAAAHGSAAGSLPAPNGPMPDREQTASAADSDDQSGPPDSGLQSSGEPAGWEAERQQCGYTPETVRTLAELMPLRT